MKNFSSLLMFLLMAQVHGQNFNWVSQNSGVTQTLHAVHFPSNNVGFTVGVNGTILKTTDGGISWSIQNSNLTDPLLSVNFVNDSVGWVAGGSGQPVLLTTSNGGGTWIPISVNNISDPILDIEFFGNGNVGFLVTQDSIFRSLDGGATWVSEPYGFFIGTAVNTCVAVRNADVAYVGGRRFQTGIQDSSPEVYDRYDPGSGYLWRASSANQFSNMDRIESLVFNSDSTGFAGGIQGKLYCLNGFQPYAGGPWVECHDLGGGNNQVINAISFLDFFSGIFSTPSQMGSIGNSLIFHTQSAGASWQFVDTIGGFQINDLQFVDPLMAIAVGNNGKIYRGTPSSMGLLEQPKKPRFSVYPVPSRDRLNINIHSGTVKKIELVGISGRYYTVESFLYEDRLEIRIDHLAKGIYGLFIRFEDGSMGFQKIIRE
ncbi:MAG: YCF48-related protein [Bacteroidota bacterium]|nr:YCF48-related protein [Bacteroidota bacterium]